MFVLSAAKIIVFTGILVDCFITNSENKNIVLSEEK
jgi:hypothetical protein